MNFNEQRGKPQYAHLEKKSRRLIKYIVFGGKLAEPLNETSTSSKRRWLEKKPNFVVVFKPTTCGRYGTAMTTTKFKWR